MLFYAAMIVCSLRSMEKFIISIRDGMSVQVGRLLNIEQKKCIYIYEIKKSKPVGYMTPKIITQVSSTILHELSPEMSASHIKRLWQKYLKRRAKEHEQVNKTS